MAVDPPRSIVYEHDKRAKEKVRKCGGSAMRKTLKLGQEARVFTATIHFNPTYGQLDGAVHVPEGQSIPDINQFLLDLYHGRQHIDRRRRSRLTRSTARHLRRESTPVLDEITVEMSDSESQELPTDAGKEGASREDANADPQPDPTGDQHESHQLEGKAETAAGDVPESAGQTIQSVAECVEVEDDADADADGSPEAVAMPLQALGREGEEAWADSGAVQGLSATDGLIEPGTSDVEIGCQTSMDGDIDWSELELPGMTENEQAPSDWLVVGAEDALNGELAKAAEDPRIASMQTKKIDQRRRLFERVSKEMWRARRDRTATEVAVAGGSYDGYGVHGRSGNNLEDGYEQRSHPAAKTQGGTSLMPRRTAQSPRRGESGCGASVEQQVRFFQALALRFRCQTGAD
ncbi:C2H2 finger domain-containing protein [Colletotrichum limetticola]|uniref:C2H2 finger domain-containing protein n=1 Tax=Colletotrichum limetticola TaxID=1209924 RepID=A0ABQ9PNV4_9PEZI|nr:C2H2 finger domain-containing protein [Colletotrichum limetticola]